MTPRCPGVVGTRLCAPARPIDTSPFSPSAEGPERHGLARPEPRYRICSSGRLRRTTPDHQETSDADRCAVDREEAVGPGPRGSLRRAGGRIAGHSRCDGLLRLERSPARPDPPVHRQRTARAPGLRRRACHRATRTLPAFVHRLRHRPHVLRGEQENRRADPPSGAVRDSLRRGRVLGHEFRRPAAIRHDAGPSAGPGRAQRGY